MSNVIQFRKADTEAEDRAQRLAEAAQLLARAADLAGTDAPALARAVFRRCV